jgi:hypothetical protein
MKGNRKAVWHSIQIDEEIFSFLQQRVRPLLDTPNDVLRRLLLEKVPAATPKPATPKLATPSAVPSNQGMDSKQFVDLILRKHFDGNFKLVGRYKFMFESVKHLAYFENFNLERKELFYRIRKEPWLDLSQSHKSAWLCLTYPPEKYAYIIPIDAVNEKAHQCGYEITDMEISLYPQIPHNETRWRQFNWDIEAYRHEF